MKVNLQPAKLSKFGRQGVVVIRSSEPFVENSRGILIHRVRHAHIVISEMFGPHLSVRAWCGNSFSSSKHLTFLESPTDGKFVCARCEEVAVSAGQPSSSDIAGKHICVGGLRAYNACHIHGEVVA